MVMEKGKSLPKDPWYRKYYWDLEKVAWHCCRCSNCKFVDTWELKSARFSRVCPSSARYLYDAYSCQGRMDITVALEIDKALQYEDSSSLTDVFYKCNTCGACDAECKRNNDMEPLRVLYGMRNKLVEKGLIPPALVPVIDGLRKDDNMMMQPKAEQGKWAKGLKVKNLTKEKAEVVYHAGCRLNHDKALWKIAKGAVTLLKDAGVDIGIMGQEEVCCGGRPHDLGFQGEFTKYATHNAEAFATAGVKTVVTSCSDCYRAFKVLYPETGINLEVLHIVEFMDRLIKEGRIKLTREVPMRVTYHDPCHLGRLSKPYVPGDPVDGVYELPREILRGIPGIELVEMERIKENAWCCGAGAGVLEAYPDFSIWTASERIEEAKSTGAEAIVTACPWCERSFINAIEAKGEKIKVYDIIELVKESM